MIIYVDGSCSKNGSVENEGGFGAVIINDDNSIQLHREREENTTNFASLLVAILDAMSLTPAAVKYNSEAEAL